jgi:hypothetical protein
MGAALVCWSRCTTAAITRPCRRSVRVKSLFLRFFHAWFFAFRGLSGHDRYE